VKFLVVHGPNLNLLGEREPALYGTTTLAGVDALLASEASVLGVEVECFQSNHEGAIVDRIQAARHDCAGILINAGAYTHSSVAIRDALLAVGLPAAEVHLSNVMRREPFRRVSMIADVAVGGVFGFGAAGYAMALRGLLEHCKR
jgi:3-dehydroquinate dehydratase-2